MRVVIAGGGSVGKFIAEQLHKGGHEVLRAGSLARLTEVSRYVYEIANMNFRSSQPFVGASAFAHKGGMHTHAIARNTAAAPIDWPNRISRRPGHLPRAYATVRATSPDSR